MVSRDALINALRSKGFTFKRQADRVELWKQSGTTRRVELRRKDQHDEVAARTLLRQAGFEVLEIDQFLATYNKRVH
jgi:hypothetical protein